MSTATYTVVGMTCGGCAGTVKQHVERVAGVTAVDVDLSGSNVTVTSDTPIDAAQVRAAVEEAGYELKA
ncbi:heavy-metal-associated domain-containing protein [Actinomadura geliboluensis]|uniref:Heavy-metal-associated domain-containing protein n=1 Tax=Actinomadura geliboluensis TaxID=882440 RepID=A0A5S4HBA6_9ACTN|nr:heavy metal-associated domain-containing protein [Actinomadura geliboluensis]TMR42256.1 heavy-metal-associated domain-containing protein [Actinomadura geliboluensis]